jgi:hypothetical protein
MRAEEGRAEKDRAEGSGMRAEKDRAEKDAKTGVGARGSGLSKEKSLLAADDPNTLGYLVLSAKHRRCFGC